MPSKPTVLSRTNSLEPDGEKWRKMQKSRLKGVRIYETYTKDIRKITLPSSNLHRIRLPHFNHVQSISKANLK